MMSESKLLTRDAILECDDRIIERVEVPEWGGHLFVRVLSGTERDALEISVQGSNGRQNLANFRARFVSAVACNAKGEGMFAQTEVFKLGGKSSLALERVFEAGQRLNGMRAEDVDELRGNSGGAQSGASGSS